MTTLIRPPASLHGVRDVQSSPRPVTGAPRQRRSRARSTIIVASDGSSGSDGAIRMALAKFDPTDTALEVVTVVASSHGEGAVAMMLPSPEQNGVPALGALTTVIVPNAKSPLPHWSAVVTRICVVLPGAQSAGSTGGIVNCVPSSKRAVGLDGMEKATGSAIFDFLRISVSLFCGRR